MSEGSDGCKISALDGYYNVYPSSHKSQFRSIIDNQLEIIRKIGFADDWGSIFKIADLRAYFDNGGSRMYTLVDDPGRVALE